MWGVMKRWGECYLLQMMKPCDEQYAFIYPQKVKNADNRQWTAECVFPPYLHSWSSFIVDCVIQILSSTKTATNDIRI